MRRRPGPLPHTECVLRTPGAESRFSAMRLLFLGSVVLLGAVYRLDFLSADYFAIDSDEAIVGLMAKHMLSGRGVPVFYYGQDYMGSLEAIIAALLGTVFGLSVLTLKLVPFIFSLLLILSSYEIAAIAGGKRAAAATSLLFAVPPFALLDWGTKARGGFIEVVFLGSLIFLISIRTAQAPRAARFFLLGLVTGTAWWVNYQVIYFLPAAGFFLLKAHLLRPRAGGNRRVMKLFALAALGAAAGSLPFWIYNFEHGFASFGLFQRVGAGEFLRHLRGFFLFSLPMLFGAKHFWHTEDIFPGASLVYGLTYLLCLGIVTAKLRRPAADETDAFRRSVTQMLLIFVGTIPIVFCASSFGMLVEAPRYVLPFYLGLFVLAGVAAGTIGKRSLTSGTALLVVLLTLNVVSAYHGGRNLPGEPLISEGDRVAKDHSELIAWLRARNIHYVRANYWLGYRLAFETQEDVLFLMHGEPHRIRIPEYEANSVVNAHRWKVPILAGRHEAAHLRKGLKRLGYRFNAEQVGSYVVFTGLDGPAESPAIRRIRLSPEQVHPNPHPESAALMIDRSTMTRWGSGGPQEASNEVAVDLRGEKVTAVHLSVGEFRTDWPRILEVETTSAEGTHQGLDFGPHFKEIAPLMSGEPDLWIWLPPRALSRLTLRQLGQSGKYDWSIAELELYTNEE